MKTETLMWVLVAAIALVPLILFGISFKRSFTPGQGEIYVITFFGKHIFEVRVGDPKVKFYQKLAFYILFWPFNRAQFMYKWVQEMTYSDYLKKLRISETKDYYNVSIDWEPEYDEGGQNADGTARLSELEADGTPKDKSVKILVVREEKMKSLRTIEGYTLAAEFETSDGFRGWRFFTLFLNIESLSKFISIIRQGQLPAQKMFSGEYNAWSKKVTYVDLRKTTMNTLNTELGSDKTSLFVDEINQKVKKYGYIVSEIAEGPIYLNLASRDMLESQELPKKATDKKNAAIVEADTAKIEAKGEADAIKLVEDAKTDIIRDRTKIAVKAAKKLTEQVVKQNKSKFGEKGLAEMSGVYVEGQGGTGNTINTEKIIENVLALKINEVQTQGGGS